MCDSMVECQLPKLNTRVRFPSRAFFYKHIGDGKMTDMNDEDILIRIVKKDLMRRSVVMTIKKSIIKELQH